jgi:hypothetical protein
LPDAPAAVVRSGPHERFGASLLGEDWRKRP